MLINDASITGSLIVNATASFQNIIVSGNIIPDTNSTRNLGSTDKYFKEIYVSTSSINFVDNGSVVATLNAGTINALQVTTASANTRLDSLESFTSSLNNTYTTDAELNASSSTLTSNINTKLNSSSFNSFTASIAATNTFTSSATTRLNALESTSASVDTLNTTQNNRLGSLETISASNISRISALETKSASVDTTNTTQNARLSALETTSASVDTLNTTQNTRITNLENKTGSLATTGSNTFIGTQIITGSVYVTANLVVQGSSSLQNITASAVSIGTNTVLLNTATPAVRFAGISVTDSGSAAGKSGSLYFDSTDDEWIFIHQGNTAVTSSTVITGPETYDNVGNETHLTDNRIPKMTKGFHIVDSNISDSGTKVTITGDLDATGAISSSTITGFGNVTTYSSSVDSRVTTNLNSAAGAFASASAYSASAANKMLTFATTGSNTFIGNQIISGNILITGSVGVGTTNPTQMVHFYGGGSAKGLVVETNTAHAAYIETLDSGSVRARLQSNNAAGFVGMLTNHPFSVYANNGEAMYLTSGSVGIGTNNPLYTVHIKSAADPTELVVENTSAGGTSRMRLVNATRSFILTNNATDGLLSFNYGGSNRLQFDTSNQWYPLGNVGIGTSSISAKLHVYSAAPTGVTSVPSGTDILIDASGNSYLTFRQTSDSGLYGGLLFVDNNVGAYIVFRNYTLSGTSVGSDSLIYGTYCDHIFQTGTSSTVNGRTETVRFTSTGKVGINSSTPDTFLDVVGPNNSGEVITAKFLNTNQNTLRLYQYGGSHALDNWNFIDVGGSEQHVGFRISSDNSKVLGLYSDGSVGIGTTIPRRKVDIRGGNLGLLYESSEAGNASWLRASGWYGTCTGGWGKYIEMGENLQWFGTTSTFTDRMGTVYGWNSDYMLVGLKYQGSQDRADAWFQIEQDQESYIFAMADTCNMCLNTANGNLYTRGGMCPNTAISDRRLKRNIETYETSMLDKMKQLRVVNFKFNEDVTQESDELQIGFIAQEVEEVLPELVMERRIVDSEDIWKGFKYDKLAIYNTKAIQELAQCIDKLESCITKLENA